jgi:ureidoglycolate hydrolase
MDFSKDLTKEEFEDFNKVIQELPADERTQNNTIKYYNLYKLASGGVTSDKILTTMKCAFFIAEKS